MLYNMRSVYRYVVCLLLIGVFPSLSHAQPRFIGVNLAGADFGEHSLPGQYNHDYTYPTPEEVDHFTTLGLNVFRLPFRWERLQQTAYADFNEAELGRLDAFVAYATTTEVNVILDPHNYARYYGDVIGSSNVAVEAFRDFWSRLATQYASNENVIFGLMNEPNSMSTELWLADANEAIDAIRKSGASNLILVPGNAWTGAHSWYQDWYGTPNSTVMQGIVDPLNNYAVELHQYLDEDFSGTSSTCVSPTIGSEKLVEVTNWLREQGLKGFLGEFGAAINATCLQALDDMLDYIDANPEAWLGWTYWAAGPWWGDYMFSIEPDEQGNDRPQTAVLLEHLALLSNTAPIVSDALPDIMLLFGEDHFMQDLMAVFSDADGDLLHFTVNSSNEEVARATVSESVLRVTAMARGSATITVTANDGRGATATASFEVSVPTGVAVDQTEGELPNEVVLQQNYPNPFNRSTNIAFALSHPSRVMLKVYNVLDFGQAGNTAML